MPTNILPLDPAKTALVVLDYQPIALAPIEGNEGLVKNVNKAVAAARASGMRIVHVRVALTDEDYAAVPPGNKAFTAMTSLRLLNEDDPKTAVHPDVALAPDDLVVRKTRISAFSSPGFGEELSAAGIDSLVIAGVATSGAVLSTVREAADKDYQLLVLTDCVGDSDQELHETLMRKVIARQTELITTDDFVTHLAER